MFPSHSYERRGVGATRFNMRGKANEKEKTAGDKLHQQQQQKSIEENQAGAAVSAARAHEECKKSRRLLTVEAEEFRDQSFYIFSTTSYLEISTEWDQQISRFELAQAGAQTCATSLTKSEDVNSAYTLKWETIIKQLFERVSFKNSKQNVILFQKQTTGIKDKNIILK